MVGDVFDKDNIAQSSEYFQNLSPLQGKIAKGEIGEMYIPEEYPGYLVPNLC